MNFKNLFLALTFTFLFQNFSKAAECIPSAGEYTLYYPITITSNGKQWFGYIFKNNNMAFILDQNGNSIGAYAASAYAFSGDCKNSYFIQFKVNVPGDDGNTYVELNYQYGVNNLYNRVLWNGVIYSISNKNIIIY